MSTTLEPSGAPASVTTTSTLRLLRLEVTDEVKGIVREPTALFFSIAMPVGFFLLFANLWGGDQGAGGLPVATLMLATFGTFGVVGVSLLNPGIGVADDRERGWLRAKRVSAVPLPVTLAAKALATLPYSVGVLVAMTTMAAVSGALDADAATILRLVVVLPLGGLPFALVGLAVGLLTTPNGATAVLNAIYIPSAVASGLWMPFEMLPAWVASLARVLPTWHLAQLGLAQLPGVGSTWAPGWHVLALAVTTLLAAAAAALAYRRARF